MTSGNPDDSGSEQVAAIDPKAVTAALKRLGLKVNADEERPLWRLSYEFYGREFRAMLMLPPDAEYFLAVSNIQSRRLQGRVEDLSADTLRLILKIQSRVLLAKVHLLGQGPETFYVALSPCSRHGWSGEKLGNRLQACAELAANLHAALSTAESSEEQR